MPEKDLRQRFRVERKMEMVAKSWCLRGEDLGRFLRSHGISSFELEDWKQQMVDGMNDGKPLDRSTKKSLLHRIALLEEELRKANLKIELQKKVQNILDQDEDRKVVEKSDDKSSKQSKK